MVQQPRREPRHKRLGVGGFRTTAVQADEPGRRTSRLRVVCLMAPPGRDSGGGALRHQFSPLPALPVLRLGPTAHTAAPLMVKQEGAPGALVGRGPSGVARSGRIHSLEPSNFSL